MPTKQRNVLIVGGAGYIGSHMIRCAQHAGYTPIVLDNLVTGHADAVGDVKLIIGDINDTVLLTQLFENYSFAAVMDFAALAQVNESVNAPARYYHNNVSGTLNLLRVMMNAKVKNFIYSSSAAVYGEPQYLPIDEKHPIAAVNPYGRSMWMVEQMLQDFSHSYDLNCAVLRYFNAAGADLHADLAERHNPETHLIPLILQVAKGQQQAVTIYGEDYPTLDGTCVRDYVHVSDICDAHLLVLQALLDGKRSCTYNLGTGHGYSVREVLTTARIVTGNIIPSVISGRRAGDPAILVADASAIQQDLNWQPKYIKLSEIIQSAWEIFVTP
ncbi:MAG: UDP-glucose 4-epimerase GalE [Pseudomonadota bacterium]